MTHKTGWIIPNQVLIYYFAGSITLDEYLETLADADKLIQEGQAPVHAISDGTELTEIPKTPHDIMAMMRSTPTPDPKAGWIVQVSPNRAQRFIATLFSQWFVKSGHFHTVATVREALEFIKNRDPRLSDLDLDQVEREYAAWKTAVHV